MKLRQRNNAFRNFPLPKGKGKEADRITKQFRWGYVNESIKSDFEAFMETQSDESPHSDFVELTSLSAWFDLHPEKVAGRRTQQAARH